MKTQLVSVAAIAIGMGLLGSAACSSKVTEESSGADEFATSVPNTQVLALTADEQEDDLVDDDSAEPPVDAEAKDGSTVRRAAALARHRVNQALVMTHARLSALFADTEPVSFEMGATACRRWEANGDGGKNTFRLVVCKRDREVDGYAFSFQGKPIGSDDKAYLNLAGGVGRALPNVDGKRRGAGKIGYNFDNLHALLGKGPTGKVGIGFRAAGKVRQLVVGLKDFQPEDAEQSVSALYRFERVIGKGGHMVFALNADFVARNGEGKLAGGQDDVDEFGRAVVGWSATGFARSAATVCGGSVGKDRCVRMHHCWKRENASTTESLAEGSIVPEWDAVQCPKASDLPKAVTESPKDQDLDVPGSQDPETGAPDIAIPEPSSME